MGETSSICSSTLPRVELSPTMPPKGVSGLDLLLQVFVLELQLLLQPLDFFERARVGDRCGGVIGKGAQPEELLLVDEGAAENSKNTNGLVPENQWVPREALDAFLPQPVAASEPFTIVSGVMKQLGFPCRADLADVSNSQWEPAVRAIHAEPVGAAVLLDGAGGACNQMKASCLVRAIRPRGAIGTDIAWPDQPDASEGHLGKSPQPLDEEAQKSRQCPLVSHVQEDLLERFELGRIVEAGGHRAASLHERARVVNARFNKCARFRQCVRSVKANCINHLSHPLIWPGTCNSPRRSTQPLKGEKQ